MKMHKVRDMSSLDRGSSIPAVFSLLRSNWVWCLKVIRCKVPFSTVRFISVAHSKDRCFFLYISMRRNVDRSPIQTLARLTDWLVTVAHSIINDNDQSVPKA